MNNPKKLSRKLNSAKLRQFFEMMADEICQMQDKVTMSITGNTFEINLEGATVNITFNKEGGQQ